MDLLNNGHVALAHNGHVDLWNGHVALAHNGHVDLRNGHVDVAQWFRRGRPKKTCPLCLLLRGTQKKAEKGT
jgi:hypothetical protein